MTADLLFLFVDPSLSWVFTSAGNVLIGQAILGLIGFIGFYAVIKRFMNNDFPIAMKGVHDRLDTLHVDLKHLEQEFQRTVLDLERMKERQDYMKSRLERLEQGQLDDTRTGARRRNPAGG